MNWLMYIGGGFIWFSFWFLLVWWLLAKNSYIDSKKFDVCLTVSVALSWIWICWRFIR